MFKLDSNFLEGLGLGEMSEVEMGAFLEHLQEELEVRVGEKMSEGLSEMQIEEFEKIIDGDKETIGKVLGEIGDYAQNEQYVKLREATGLVDGSDELLGEFVSIKWLQKNRPDYQGIVERTVDELKAEVAEGKDAILNKDKSE